MKTIKVAPHNSLMHNASRNMESYPRPP